MKHQNWWTNHTKSFFNEMGIKHNLTAVDPDNKIVRAEVQQYNFLLTSVVYKGC